MARSAVISVGTSATQLSPTSGLSGVTGEGVVLRNTGAAAVFLGGPDVTTTTGLTLAAGATLTIPVETGALWGIVATGTINVEVLYL